MASFWEVFSGKKYICCALTVQYSIYNTVGRSVSDICRRGDIFTNVQNTLVTPRSYIEGMD